VRAYSEFGVVRGWCVNPCRESLVRTRRCEGARDPASTVVPPVSAKQWRDADADGNRGTADGGRSGAEDEVDSL
jgi:hypothetical protein